MITNKKYEYYRRRIIGRHPTEWQGEENSEFIKMLELLTRKKDEPEQLSTHLIGIIQKYLEDYPDIQRAKALFNHEKERIEKLSFWKDVPELATKQPYHINPIAFVGNVIPNMNYYIDNDGFIRDVGIIKNKINWITRHKIKPVAIVLHRTDIATTKKTIDGWKNVSKNPQRVGAHFVIDKDGQITQVVGIYNRANHVGLFRVRSERVKNKTAGTAEMRKSYPERYPYNNDSIGIEVTALNLWSSGWGHKGEWEEATPEQKEAVEFLIKILQQDFNFHVNDLYQHQYISPKTHNEGFGLYEPADTNDNIDSRF